MRRFYAFIALLCFSTHIHGQQRPKLVVGLVVDQMRWDYLYRYYERYGEGGFKKLLNSGFSCDHTMINYMPAYTAPGHACIYTGSVPAIHGIAGNNWFDNATGKYSYCVDDSSVTAVGGSRSFGMMSPKNMVASTITDELRQATNFRSRVFAISLKDRSSILPGGHLANGAYWFDDSTGNLISSSYYGKTLPAWLLRFNDQRLPDTFLSRNWELLYPAATYVRSLPDNNLYEGKFIGEKLPVFPHEVRKTASSYINLRKVPAGNTYSFAAARACLEGERLGMGGETDFLCLSLSATDYIGHQYGPNAMETEDMYLRLDKDIAGFLSYLDSKLGKNNYIFFLTADHGGAHNGQFMADNRIPGGNEFEYTVTRDLVAFLKKEYNQDSLIRGMENYQVFFNEDRIQAAGVNKEQLKARIKEWFCKKPQVAFVIDMDDMNKTAVPEPIRTMAVNGYYRPRSGSLLVVNNPGWYYGYSLTGTTHGTWHPYDTHIPLLWYGWKIGKGSTSRTVHMEDIAATLAALLHIQMPNGCIGTVIPEIVK